MSAQTQAAPVPAGQIKQTAEQLAGQVPLDQVPLDQVPVAELTDLSGQAATISTFSWSGYFMTIAVLCLLLAGLWLALRWLKKRGTLRRFGGNEEMEMESRLSLGPKRNLLIVRLRDRRLLLGVTEHHISKLAELPLYYYDEADDGDEAEQ